MRMLRGRTPVAGLRATAAAGKGSLQQGTSKRKSQRDPGETPSSFALGHVDIRLRVKGGGFTGQIYALRQAEP